MDKKQKRKERFIKICKKILPWLLGGAAAIGGVIVGYNMMDKEPSIEENKEEDQND